MRKRLFTLEPFETTDIFVPPGTKVQGGMTSELLRRGLPVSGLQAKPKQQRQQTNNTPAARLIDARKLDDKDKS